MPSLSISYSNAKASEYTTSVYHLEDCLRKDLASCVASNDPPEIFLKLIDDFLEREGDPNLLFSEFNMQENVFRNVTLFQLVYLYWKDPLIAEELDEELDEKFQEILDEMLDNEQTELSAEFTEHSLPDGGHFLHNETDWWEKEAQGYLLEKATIAHYAVAIGDMRTFKKVLKRAPDLINSTCRLVKGKQLLYNASITHASTTLISQEESAKKTNEAFFKKLFNNTSHIGTLAHVTKTPLKNKVRIIHSIVRTGEVSLLHLAAKTGNDSICRHLQNHYANYMARDSKNHNPLDYIPFYIERAQTKKLEKILDPISEISRDLLKKEHCLSLREEGYWNMFDTSRKVTRVVSEYLTKASFGKEKRTDSFEPHPDLSEQDQASNADFKPTIIEKGIGKERNKHFQLLKNGKVKTGKGVKKVQLVRGHMRAAANASGSKKAMDATFMLTNVIPQDKTLNTGYWKVIENHVRKLFASPDVHLVEVMTGCGLEDQGTIGKGEVAVPKNLFKVLYIHRGSKVDVEAYLVPNTPIKGAKIGTYKSTVEQVQKVTGIAFDAWRRTKNRKIKIIKKEWRSD